jgi:hypothetical protein
MMFEKPLGDQPVRSGCRLSILVGLALLACLSIPIIRWQLWLSRERANVEQLAEEARRFGGNASIPEGGIDFSERKMDVFLDLARSPIGDEEFARLASMPAFRHTRRLDLSDTRISDKSLRLLEHNPELTVLDVSGTQITDKGLASLVNIPFLNEIGAARTIVTDRGLEALAERSGSWHLRGLDLTDTHVTAEGVRRICKAFDFLVVKHPAAVHP